jgi:hypothetical protein
MSQPAKTRSSRAGQRHEILNHRRTRFGSLAEPHGGELGKRSDRHSKPSLHGFNAGHEGRTHCANSWYEDAEFTVRGRNTDVIIRRQNDLLC